MKHFFTILFIILLILVLIVAGSYMIKRMNLLFKTNGQKRTASPVIHNDNLMIALETPFMTAAIAEQLEIASQKYPNMKVYLYTDSVEEITKRLLEGTIDIGFVLSKFNPLSIDSSQKASWKSFQQAKIQCTFQTIYGSILGSHINPLNTEPQWVSAIWNPSKGSKMKLDFLRILLKNFTPIGEDPLETTDMNINMQHKHENRKEL